MKRVKVTGMIRLGWVVLLSLCLSVALYSQSASCDTCGHVTTIIVDLSSNPADSAFIEDVGRSGNCCIVGNTDCIRFDVTLHPEATILNFRYEGANTGTFFVDSCNNTYDFGDTICVNGVGPHYIVYCKPGGNVGDYTISSSKTVRASDNITVSNGCSAEVYAEGLDEASVAWKTVYPGFDGDYNSYLSCLSGCDTTVVTPGVGYPEYIDIEVTGTQDSYCAVTNVRDTVRVYFVTDKEVTIAPENPAICFGGASATLTATPTGGAAPYTYYWIDEANDTIGTTQSISVNTPGDYVVAVYDTTDCPPVYDTVTLIAHTSEIAVDAGVDTTICSNGSGLILYGSVTQATGGVWSGYSGSFNPDSATLNAIYMPSAAEVIAGNATLTLTTTGNGGCAAQSDDIIITIEDGPLAEAGANDTICAGSAYTVTSGHAAAINSNGISWSTNGSGNFTNDVTLEPTYSPSDADTTAGSVYLRLHVAGNANCIASVDSMLLVFTQAPYADAGANDTVCAGTAYTVPNSHVTIMISSSVAWSTSGTGSFINANTLVPTYTPSDADTTAGQVYLRLHVVGDGLCNDAVDSMLLVLTPQPYVDAGLSDTICVDVSYTISTANSSNASSINWSIFSGNGSLLNNSSITPTYVPDASDAASDVTLRITANGNASCIPVNDDMVLTIKTGPITNAGSGGEECDLDFNLGATPSAGTGTWTKVSGAGTPIFTPNSNDATASVSVSAYGTYIFKWKEEEGPG